MAISGEAISKGHNMQDITNGQLFTAGKYERVYLLASSISALPE
jgi:hypothetical protein